MKFRTHIAKAKPRSELKWYLVDANGKTLGHIADKIADLLRGKNKADFTPHVEMGDFVVVVNADKVALSGNKETQKSHIHHTQYWGHLRAATISRVRATHPERIIEQAVGGMIPCNRMKKFILRKLKVYAGAEHPHTAQKLEPVTF